MTLDKLREYANEAKQQPGALAEFRIKRLNRRAAASDGWINLLRWRKCGGPVDLDALKGARCWAGLDLASTRDMSAVRYLWVKDEHWYSWGRYWVPESAVAQRNERGTLRYQPWVQSGHLTVTDGDVTDYRTIERDLLADIDRFRPRALAFDPWNAAQLVTQIAEARPRLKLIQFRQGPQSYHPAMQALERAYTGENFSHGGDPVLLWNAANLVVRRDVNLNMAPDRKRSADKIDGLVALLMAFGVAVSKSPRRATKFILSEADMTMHRAYGLLTVKAVAEESGQTVITGTASTPETDRIGDIVEPMGAKFRLPLPLLWQHESKEAAVGRVEFARATEDGIPFRAVLPHVKEEGALKKRVDLAIHSSEIRPGRRGVDRLSRRQGRRRGAEVRRLAVQGVGVGRTLPRQHPRQSRGDH